MRRPQTNAKPDKRWSRALAVLFVACTASMTTGCGHLFATEEAEPKLPVKKPAPAKAAIVVTPAQRAQAKALHATAREQMGRGAIGPAVSNLTKAAKLDPTNEQVQRDLVRANRIRTAVASGEAPPRRGRAD